MYKREGTSVLLAKTKAGCASKIDSCKVIFTLFHFLLHLSHQPKTRESNTVEPHFYDRFLFTSVAVNMKCRRKVRRQHQTIGTGPPDLTSGLPCLAFYWPGWGTNFQILAIYLRCIKKAIDWTLQSCYLGKQKLFIFRGSPNLSLVVWSRDLVSSNDLTT